MSQLTLTLLGGFAARTESRATIHFRSQKARALLAYLIMEAGRPHERATLAALFWPEMPDALALRNLSQTLIWLRQAVGDGDPPFLHLTRRQIQWNAAAPVDVDALRFCALLERRPTPTEPPAAALRQAVALYRGEFLAGFGLPGCPAFDEWLLLQREHFQRLALEALFQLAEEALAAGDWVAAATLARRQLALDRWREDAIRQLLHALAAAGRPSEALAEYENARRLLAQELAVAPQPETIQLAEAIRQGKDVGGGRPSLAAPAAPQPTPTPPAESPQPAPPPLPAESSPPRPLHNLPVRLGSLLGRESELAALSGWLRDPETRLATISGIGGVGKTRLALAVAASFMSHPAALQPADQAPQPSLFPDGVWFVQLAGLPAEFAPDRPGQEAGELFVAAIATTLGVALNGPESPARQLERYLRNRRLLLVLNNYEHLLSTRPILLSLLHNAPGVRALVTSRERLAIGGERLLQLEGLPLPPSEAAQSQDALLAYSSARLFVTRALEHGTHLTLDEAERRSLIRICHLAEGLPLVIELAAAWAGHYTCAEIAAEITANLDFLNAESAAARVDLPARQRSPRAAFDYAWRLLSPAEQRALAQLALLQGPFSREAALTVSEARLVDLISLLNKSLLRQTSPGWYAMHSLVCQFAAEQLRAMPGLLEASRQRYVAYFLGFVADREHVWHTLTPQQARDDIRPVRENVRAAWQWAIQHQAWAVVEKALISLIGYYRSEGLLSEAIEVLRHLTEQLHPPATHGSFEARLLSRALFYQAALVMRRDMKADAGLELARASVEWAQHAADPLSQSLAAYAHGSALLLAATLSMLPPNEVEGVRQTLEQSISFGRQVPATAGLEKLRAAVMEVQTLIALGNYHMFRGERTEAWRCYDEALRLCRAWGNVLGEGQIYIAFGLLRENEGSLEQALRYHEEALRVFRKVNEPDSVSATLGILCSVLTYLGNYERALEHGRLALQLRQQSGLVSHLLYHRLALAAFHGDDEAQALQLLAEAMEETALSPHTYQFRLVAGECTTRLGRWEEATEALQLALALALAQKGNNPLAVTSVRRAQADLALAQGNTAVALTYAEALLPLLAGAPLPAASEPLRLYWTCYRALQANNDPRAAGVLAAAHGLLQSQAALIQDDALRQTFLHQVAANWAIAAEWKRTQDNEGTTARQTGPAGQDSFIPPVAGERPAELLGE